MFLFCRNPESKTPTKLKELIESKGYKFFTSYDINDLKSNYQTIITFGGKYIYNNILDSPNVLIEALGDEGIEKIKNFVETGGRYFGLKGGAQMASQIQLVDVPFLKPPSLNLQSKILLRSNHFKKDLECLYHNGSFYDPKKLKDDQILSENVGFIDTVEDSNLSRNTFKTQMKDKAAIIKQKFGHGDVICCGCNPEITNGLEEFTFDLLTKL